jgi:DnaJ-class molecular chaperone
VLGVSPGSTRPEITEAFRRFALRHHPDRGGDADRFQTGLDAYRHLTGSKPPIRHGTSGAAAENVVFHRRARPGVTSILRVARRRLAATRSRS